MDDALSDMLNSIINSEPDLAVEINSEVSPINKENKKVSAKDNRIANNPLNPRDSNKSSENTSALDNSLTSKNEELLTPDTITDTSSNPTININLAQIPTIEKENSENTTPSVLNTTSSYNNLNTTVNNIDNSNTLNVSNTMSPSPLNTGTNTIIDRSQEVTPTTIENILKGIDSQTISNETINSERLLLANEII